MDNVTGDLFVGEAKLFFTDPRRQWRLPLRVETGRIAGSVNTTSGTPATENVSFSVHVDNPNLIMLCDSRMDATRVAKELCASDIGVDTDVPAYESDNTSRWTVAEVTSDGRHWSNGEYHWKYMLDAKRASLELDEQRRNDTLANLTTQLPPSAVEAVRDGRAIIISRTKHIAGPPATPKAGTIASSGRERVTYTPRSPFVVRRVCKSFGNWVYAIRRERTESAEYVRTFVDGDEKNTETIALLVFGKVWPKEVAAATDTATLRPVLTVARVKSVKATTVPGGRVFCICLGNHLKRLLAGYSAERIAGAKRHYEGYFDDTECGGSLRQVRSGSDGPEAVDRTDK